MSRTSKLQTIGREAEASPAFFNSLESNANKKRTLKSVELHVQAKRLIEQEVSRYREDLYVSAKSIAKSEMEEHIITEAHAMKAKQMLCRRRSRYSFSDGFLALGALLLGSAGQHIIGLMQSQAQPDLRLIVSGMVGGVFFGMGIIGKARRN